LPVLVLMTKKPSAASLLAELKRLAKIFPGAGGVSEITRDFFRANSSFKDKWSAYYPTFDAFLNAAGLKTVIPFPPTKSPPVVLTPDMKLDLEKEKLKAKHSGVTEQLRFATERIVQLETELDSVLCISQKTPQLTIIVPKTPSSVSESVAVMVGSDWHIEENVDPATVNNKNSFNLEIMEQRVLKFFQGQFRMFDILRRDTTISTIVLALLGDFITNTIHEDLQESNNLLPAEAIYRAECLIVSGIKFLLENTPPETELLIVCHSGNHGRMTKKQRGTTEAGNSLEHFMYYHLRDFFKGESRVKFQIAEGYHSFVTLFDNKYRIRLHHGHAINYGGGVGGITIPVLKAIAQWNIADRADLDLFGHFHQFIDYGNFVANGSLIGYNDFAVRIKATFEKPQQAFFLVNKKWNSKTMATPIFLT
jgi:hypothetical protein